MVSRLCALRVMPGVGRRRIFARSNRENRSERAAGSKGNLVNSERNKKTEVMDGEAVINARFANVALDELDHAAWNEALPAHLTRLWSGEATTPTRHAEARVLWSKKSLSVRFVCRQTEPLIVHPAPQTKEKTIGLWERDVCEIFIAPNADEPEKYFEFEAAPTGEWIDLALRITQTERETDWQYQSGMTVAARVDEGFVTIALRVPWVAFGVNCSAPQIGTCWRANLFRCVGTGSERYIAWQPTRTAQPNFHVPEAFGWLCFSD
jgi:alpha-galactosidase